MEVFIISEEPNCLKNHLFAESKQRVKLKKEGNFLKFVDVPKNRHYVEIDNITGETVTVFIKSRLLANRLHCGMNYQCRLEANEVCFFGKYSNITGENRGKGITFQNILENDAENIKWMLSVGYIFEPNFREQITDRLHLAV